MAGGACARPDLALPARRARRYHRLIREPATSAPARGAAPDDARGALAEPSRAAFELLTRAVARLEPLGGAGEIAPVCARLQACWARDHALVELAGARRSQVVDLLLGAHLLAPAVAASVTIRLRSATVFDYEVRWLDGRVERMPPDDHAAQAAALTACEREVERLTAAAEAARARLRVAVEAGSAPPPSPEMKVAAPRLPAAPRGWLRRLFARLAARLRALFAGSARSSLPASSSSAAPPLLLPASDALGLEAELAAADARVASRAAERDQRRRALDDYDAERERRGRARLVELSSSAEPGWRELDIGTPALAPGIVIILRPPGSAREREPLDATLFVDGPGVAAPFGDDAPIFHVEYPLAQAALARQLQLLCQQRDLAIARRIVATLCLCKNRILDLDVRARAAHQERARELAARRVDEADVVRREESSAQLPIARQAEQVVHDAAARLDVLLAEVRDAWQQRVDSCAGVEQLRAEVAAIEDGAAHRLALVCDELRETMTIQFVRLVLELSRPLRQELMRRRLEVARGRSPKLEQGFDDIRLVLPASLDATFGALKTPEIGELLPSERGLFDPLFRTLARQKRECATRLRARLDDIERTTTRDLYAAAVYVSPLLVATFKGLLAELVGAHRGWIDALVAEEQLAWQELCARHQPALELVEPLERAAAELAALLEAS